MIESTIGAAGTGAGSVRAQYEKLIDAFGKGWEAALPSAMAEVFTEDGAFVASPFDPAVRGRAAIADYWGDVPLEQAAISFRFGEIFIAGPWFSTEFTCTYRRIRTGEWIQVGGALFCETAGEKISEMRMYWERAVVPAP